MELSKHQRAHNVASGLVQHYTNMAREGLRILTKGAPEAKVSVDEIKKAMSPEQLGILQKVNDLLVSPEERKLIEAADATPPAPKKRR